MGSELPQEADIVLEEQAEVGDVVLEHRQAVQPGAEGKAGIVVRVDAAVAEYLRMDHARAQDLQPAALAASTTRSPANSTRHRRRDARFRKGEMIAENADAPIGTEQRKREVFDGSLQVGKTNVAIDDEAFELIELGSVRGVRRVPPVDGARSDDPDRRLMALHVADLHR